MFIASVRHRGLQRLVEEDDPRFLPPDLRNRARRIVTLLVEASDMNEFRAKALPGWRLHRLSGNRSGEWSVRVSGNWRITFAERGSAINRLDLEDYH